MRWLHYMLWRRDQLQGYYKLPSHRRTAASLSQRRQGQYMMRRRDRGRVSFSWMMDGLGFVSLSSTRSEYFDCINRHRSVPIHVFIHLCSSEMICVDMCGLVYRYLSVSLLSDVSLPYTISDLTMVSLVLYCRSFL